MRMANKPGTPAAAYHRDCEGREEGLLLSCRGLCVASKSETSGAQGTRRGGRLGETVTSGDAVMLDANNPANNSLLTNEQLASLGGGRIAYLRPIRSEELSRLFPAAPPVEPGLQLFALLAADGTPIVITDSRDAAVANAMSHELEMVGLH
jgi:hypothetical protein